MNTRIKSLLHIVGGTLAFTGIVYVTIKLYAYSGQIDFSSFNHSTWLIAVFFAFLYGASNIMLALAWKNLLIYFGNPIHWRSAIRIYGQTQLAKYVPGNIMHLASRQTMGMASGIRAMPLAKSSAWELGLIALTAIFFAVLVLPQFYSAVSQGIAVLGFMFTLIVVQLFIVQVFGSLIAKAVVWYALFLLTAGLLFAVLLNLLTPESSLVHQPLLVICGAFVLAWLAGLITPGAPAGIGIREAILALLLKGLTSESELLLCIMLSRMITVTGDLIFFICASVLSLEKKENT